MEKQRDKAARRMQRKLNPGEPEPDTETAPEATDDGLAPTDDSPAGVNAESSAKGL